MGHVEEGDANEAVITLPNLDALDTAACSGLQLVQMRCLPTIESNVRYHDASRLVDDLAGTIILPRDAPCVRNATNQWASLLSPVKVPHVS